jgi:homoserine acetyltransferase
MQDGWIEAPHHLLNFGDFALESGEVVEDFVISFAIHGDPADQRFPVALSSRAIFAVKV